MLLTKPPKTLLNVVRVADVEPSLLRGTKWLWEICGLLLADVLADEATACSCVSSDKP